MKISLKRRSKSKRKKWSYVEGDSGEDHSVAHGRLAVEEPICLGKNDLNVGAEHELVIVGLDVLYAGLGAEPLGHLAAEPDGLVALYALRTELHQQLWRLVVVDGWPAANDVTQEVDSVDLAEGIRGARVAYKADLVVEVEVGLDVLLVELGSGQRADAVVVLRLVVVLPDESLWRHAQADRDYPVDHRHLLDNSLLDLLRD